MKKIALSIFFLFLFSASPVLATVGVGVGVGKIDVEEKLKPGVVYELPSITVINTGDEPSLYEMAIEHHEAQPELIPKDSWFIISPQSFELQPGKVQEVKFTLNLPIKTEPGKYFAYLEARPTKKTDIGTTAVNIAAATKLTFTVEPGSFLTGIVHKLMSLWKVYTPWPQIIMIILFLLISLVSLKRFINIEIKFAKAHKIPRWIIGIVIVLSVFLYAVVWAKVFKVF